MENWQRSFAPHQEGRRTERINMMFMAQLREAGATRFAVTVKDLSVLGFRCESQFGMQEGTRVWLTIPGLNALEATVMWKHGYAYGCKFDKALHIAVLDHICSQNKA